MYVEQPTIYHQLDLRIIDSLEYTYAVLLAAAFSVIKNNERKSRKAIADRINAEESAKHDSLIPYDERMSFHPHRKAGQLPSQIRRELRERRHKKIREFFSEDGGGSQSHAMYFSEDSIHKRVVNYRLNDFCFWNEEIPARMEHLTIIEKNRSAGKPKKKKGKHVDKKKAPKKKEQTANA